MSRAQQNYQLVKELEGKLDRHLTEKEKSFVQWMINRQKSMDEQGK